MLSEQCGDDRFELIDKAKAKLIKTTNIEMRPDEMAVIDSVLFRCWQMGWLDQLRDDNSRYAERLRDAEMQIADLKEQFKLANETRRAICVDCGTPLSGELRCTMCASKLESDTPPYDELLRCLENDWHISASWDGLRKFWCIELTDEGVKMRDAELRSDT